jgi:hypothetical protein
VQDGYVDQHLGVHCLDEHGVRIVWVGAHDYVAGQQQSDLAVDIDGAVGQRRVTRSTASSNDVCSVVDSAMFLSTPLPRASGQREEQFFQFGFGHRRAAVGRLASDAFPQSGCDNLEAGPIQGA